MSYLQSKSTKEECRGGEICGEEISFTHFKFSGKVKPSSQFDQRKDL